MNKQEKTPNYKNLLNKLRIENLQKMQDVIDILEKTDELRDPDVAYADDVKTDDEGNIIDYFIYDNCITISSNAFYDKKIFNDDIWSILHKFRKEYLILPNVYDTPKWLSKDSILVASPFRDAIIKKNFEAFKKALTENLKQGGDKNKQKYQNKSPKKINEIIIVEPKNPDEDKYKFVINGNYPNAKFMWSRWMKTLLNVIEGKEVPFNASIADYINYNSKCTLYHKGEYKLTHILFKNACGNFKIDENIKAELITQKAYKIRQKKHSPT